MARPLALLALLAIAVIGLLWSSRANRETSPTAPVARSGTDDEHRDDVEGSAPATDGVRSSLAAPLSDEPVAATPPALRDPVRLQFVDWWTRRPDFAGSQWIATRDGASVPFEVSEDSTASVDLAAGAWSLESTDGELAAVGDRVDAVPGGNTLVMAMRRTTLRVLVTDRGGRPIEGARVRWWPPYALDETGNAESAPPVEATGGDGVATIEGVTEPRSGTLRVTASGFYPAEVSSAAACALEPTGDDFIAEVQLDDHGATGVTQLTLNAPPEGGWVRSSDALWYAHGFYDGEPRWGGADTVILGHARLGAPVSIPPSMHLLRRCQFVLGEHEVDWWTEDNLPLAPGDRRTIDLPPLVEIEVRVQERNGEPATLSIHATIPAAGARPRLTWSLWDADFPAEEGAPFRVPQGASLEVRVRTESGRTGSVPVETAREGASVDVPLAAPALTKELVIDAPGLDLVRASVYDATDLRPHPSLRRGSDGLFRIPLPLKTYSLDVFPARGPGLRIRLADQNQRPLPRLALTEHSIAEARVALADIDGEPVVGAHLILSPEASMSKGDGPYVTRRTADGAFQVTWNNRIHATSDASGVAVVHAPPGDYVVDLESNAALMALDVRAILRPADGTISIQEGEAASVTLDARRTLTLEVRTHDHPPGEPRRFDVTLEGEHFGEQLSGERVRLEIGTTALRIVVHSPIVERESIVEIPAGRDDLTIAVDL
ncbi:MAG: Ig-like domain-containing protein [Planctomycetota bacterium]